MVDITVRVPDSLAEKLEPMRAWLPYVLELSLAGFRTLAGQTVSEIIEFLASGPVPSEVLGYNATERASERAKRLLALNRAGIISSDEQLELEELEQVEHIVTLLKAQAQEMLLEGNKWQQKYP